MIYRFLVLTIVWFSHGTLVAQIYPALPDLQKKELSGPVQLVITTTRTYSPETERWQPLVSKVVSTYNQKGQLVNEVISVSHEKSDTRLFTYDKDSDSLRPVIDISPSPSDTSRIIMKRVYSYMASGRKGSEVERNYQTGKTIQRQYLYNGTTVRFIIEQDSAVGSLSTIEEFFYIKGAKPRGSTIRRFDPKTDLVTSIKDAELVPEERIEYDYTSYVYTDTATPVIFWKWEYGNDTVVDRQEVKRFLDNGKLAARIIQEFADGKISRSRTLIFNKYGDPLSTADSYGNDTTYERAFDYIYDKPDKHGSWQEKRQYVVTDPDDLTNEQRLLVQRVDRVIKYFEED